MLWDIIRNFIVQHITGGWTSAGEEYSVFGGVLNYYENGSFESETTGINGVMYQINNSPDGLPYYLGFGDWLATTITAILMCLIVVFAVWLVRWIFKAVSSAFLLK